MKINCLNQDYLDGRMNKIIMMELNDITYKINGCAMKVHNTLGNGFQGVNCLHHEDKLSESGLSGWED